jgi:predicted membrane protein
MLIATYVGYYFGIVSGLLVDKVSNMFNFWIASVLTIIGFIGCIIAIGNEEFGVGIQVLTIISMIIAGLGSSVAFITSIATVAKNFSRDLSILFVALLLTYMKTAEAFDDAIHNTFFAEGKDTIYFIVMGSIVAIVYALGSLGLTSKKEGEKDNPELAVADKVGALIFVGTVGLYMLLLWLFEKLLEI